MIKHCPACGAQPMQLFFSLDPIPVHSVRLIWSQEEALQFPTGGMDLGYCQECGFISNLSFQPEVQDYADEYESTQAFSPTFNSFSHKLAQQLVDRYQLHHKEIIEIGCGQGEFLRIICQLGNNRGTGFDPAFIPESVSLMNGQDITVIPDYYSEKYGDYQADFIVCKMTLEHIQDVSRFVETVRRSIGDRKDITVFFQVPDVRRILNDSGFWDIYYEHCSYFSLGSIARLFRRQGFEVTDLWRDYGDQYLMIEAQPADGPTQARLPQENDLQEIALAVKEFTRYTPGVIDRWRKTICDAAHQDKKVILWGSGSKAVAFLTTLKIYEEIQVTVDVNPRKHNTYLAGTGQKVVPADALIEYRPDLVILMNPLYLREVRGELNARGLSPKILSVDEYR